MDHYNFQESSLGIASFNPASLDIEKLKVGRSDSKYFHN